MRKTNYSPVFSFLFILIAVYFGFYPLTSSNTIVSENNKNNFSSENAFKHLKNITKKPHYVGSKEHQVVRNYLVDEFKKLGLEVEIQEQVAINKKWKAATNTKNILAKIKGTANTKALLLLSHYDSSPHSSLGASDAGSGVVTILEGVRVFLASGKKPKNDIIILISDAEELGLLGANAFVNHHPWAKNIGMVLNFEARGSGGPSYMLLETNGGNKKLIESFNAGKPPFPIANSLMYSVYKKLPNDTDLTVFREDGDIDGFNFAFIDDHFDYHTKQDSFERMNLNTFHHQASYLLPLLNYYANEDLTNLKSTTDEVYFNIPFIRLIHFPFSWVFPVTLVLIGLFLILILVGIKQHKIKVTNIVKGFWPFLKALIISGLIAYFGWEALLKIHSHYRDILQGFTYNGHLYIAAFVAITLAICFWMYRKYFKNYSSLELSIAPLFLWGIINLLIAMYLKGSGFFIIPFAFAILIFALQLFSKRNNLLLYTILSIPAIIIIAPLIKMFPVGLGLSKMLISTVFTVLLIGLLLPVIQQYKNQKSIQKLFFIIAVFSLITATFTASFNSERKKPNSMIYMLDAQENKAYWATYNDKTDAFTKQFLGDNPTQGSFDSVATASKYKTKIKQYTNAAIKPIEPPLIEFISDTIIGTDRHMCIRILSQRNANKIELLTNSEIKFKRFIVNGEAVKNLSNNNYVYEVAKGTILSYFRTDENESLDLEIVIDKATKTTFEVLDIKFDLLQNKNFEITPRTPEMIPTPFVINDATIIKKQISI